MSSVRGTLALTVLLILLTISPGHVQDHKLLPPTETPILTIEGNIRTTNADGVAQFDRDMLERLGMTTLTTTTPWFTGPVEFEGVLLEQIMAFVGAQGTEVVAVALNDYRTTIPLKDFNEFDVILALKRDKKYMPVSDKGPLFVVYPYDSSPELHTQKYYARSIWQLTRLIVR
ncbi:putative pterin-binding protein [Pseudaminobacter sp. NGMCC 1.201702]|uniref:oxidoreductase n=1 Tax=Pseudaminobacter sp. NGMCC 1.201702 TaxID=3391825 RepID=UPI0039F0BA46